MKLRIRMIKILDPLRMRSRKAWFPKTMSVSETSVRSKGLRWNVSSNSKITSNRMGQILERMVVWALSYSWIWIPKWASKPATRRVCQIEKMSFSEELVWIRNRSTLPIRELQDEEWANRTRQNSCSSEVSTEIWVMGQSSQAEEKTTKLSELRGQWLQMANFKTLWALSNGKRPSWTDFRINGTKISKVWLPKPSI